jgi:hypothetical protein
MTDSRFRSQGGIAVLRSYDASAERLNGKLQFDEEGNILNPWHKVTGKFVCTYSYRHDNPYYFFQDCLKTLIYYGCLGHLEEGIQYVENAFRDNGFVHYLQKKPRELGGKGNRLQTGTKATADIVEAYVTKLRQDVFENWYLYDHVNLLKDARLFNTKTRGKRDLTVAAGYALLADMDSRHKKKVEPEVEEFMTFYPTYDHPGQGADMKKYLGSHN